MNYRTSAFFACLAVAGLALAENYEVTVPLGETNRIDAAFVSALGSKDLVKKGRGVLWSSSAMANYAGKITVEEGAFMVSGPSDLGTTAGTTEVKPGATLILCTGAGIEGSAGNDGLTLSESISVGGSGDSQWGAAIFQPAGSSSQQKAFAAGVSLTEDTTFAMMTRAGFTGGELFMHGHTLTVIGGIFNFQRSRITPRDSSAVGDIVVERGGTFQVGGSVSGQFGDPARTVTVKDGAMLYFYEAWQLPLWKLVVEEGGGVSSDGGASFAEWTSVNRWGGEVVWNSTADKMVMSKAVARLTFGGAVTGTGTIRANCGTVAFEKDVSIGGFDVSGTAVVNLPSSDRYWGHGGMMIGYRADGSFTLFTPGRQDVSWSYCAEGPGPQLGLVNWPLHNPETFCSRGYIWNREATNVTYTVFVGVPYQNYMYLDGVNVYNNKRDNWGGTYAMTLTPGPHSIDIITVAYGTGGPRSDNDKPRIVDGAILQDPGNGYLFTTDTVDRATVLLEHSHKLSNIALAGSSVLDAGGLPVEITNFTGVPEVANTPACMLKGVWTLTAADINAGKVLNVTEGSFTFDNVTIAIDDVDAIAHADHAWRHVICTAAEPIAGIQTDVVFQGAKRTWKLVLSDNGKELALEYQPNGMTVIVR